MRRLTAILLACTWIGTVPLMAADQTPANPQDQLAMTALEGLMSAPADRALPLLQKVLNGNRSTEVKRRALFVLSQFEEPQAQTLLLESARNGNPELRQEAIRSIGIGGRDDTLAALSEIYRGGDEAIREAVLEAWMISDREQEIFEVAMNASSSEEAERAIQLLGVMDARESLQRLQQAGKGSSGLVQAFAIADDLDSLKAMANDASDPAVQIEAVQAIGIIDNDSARVALQQIYRDTRSAEVREAALQGMLIADDEAGVLKLYQGSNDPAEKQQLLRTLTMIGGDAALEAIDAALEGRSP
ncbi:MAG: HEAT repeat domain-containing protein [Xanthomonadales bacterium]|nr:HEAT repeat domain-containing protein [Xanthomonadales bacterium]